MTTNMTISFTLTLLLVSICLINILTTKIGIDNDGVLLEV